MGLVQPNIAKNIEKIVTAFSNLNNYTKLAIKIGILLFLGLFAIGTLLVVQNHTGNFSTYNEFVATSVIKASFTVLSEIVIGGLLVDFVFNSKK
jgi:hypothetical protein